MIEAGRVCVKTAGRDAGLMCVIVENIDDVYVKIDGQTRRRKCNVAHLEVTDKMLSLKKGSHDEVKSLFESELNIELKDKKPKEQKERPRKQRKSVMKKIEAEETKKKSPKEKAKVKPKEKIEIKAEPKVKQKVKVESKVEEEPKAEAKSPEAEEKKSL